MALRDRLRTERLELRPYSLADAPAVLAYSQDPDWQRFQQTAPATEPEAERVVAALLLRDRAEQPAWAIVRADQVVGIVSLVFSAGHRLADLGYGIHADHRGIGLTAEAVAAVLDEAFGSLPQLARVAAQMSPHNARSARMLSRLGFAHEGTFRSAAVARGGELVDAAVYGLLRAEWDARAR
jgi:ribosomal-protein-alanine N-acetyltransferase